MTPTLATAKTANRLFVVKKNVEVGLPHVGLITQKFSHAEVPDSDDITWRYAELEAHVTKRRAELTPRAVIDFELSHLRYWTESMVVGVVEAVRIVRSILGPQCEIGVFMGQKSMTNGMAREMFLHICQQGCTALALPVQKFVLTDLWILDQEIKAAGLGNLPKYVFSAWWAVATSAPPTSDYRLFDGQPKSRPVGWVPDATFKAHIKDIKARWPLCNLALRGDGTIEAAAEIGRTYFKVGK